MFRPAYLDHNATTPLDLAVLAAMLPWLESQYGNASSRHEYGRRARQAIDEARQQVAAHAVVREQPRILEHHAATPSFGRQRNALRGIQQHGLAHALRPQQRRRLPAPQLAAGLQHDHHAEEADGENNHDSGQ